jgi:hypothetical protein
MLSTGLEEPALGFEEPVLGIQSDRNTSSTAFSRVWEPLSIKTLVGGTCTL